MFVLLRVMQAGLETPPAPFPNKLLHYLEVPGGYNQAIAVVIDHVEAPQVDWPGCNWVTSTVVAWL